MLTESLIYVPNVVFGLEHCRQPNAQCSDKQISYELSTIYRKRSRRQGICRWAAGSRQSRYHSCAPELAFSGHSSLLSREHQRRRRRKHSPVHLGQVISRLHPSSASKATRSHICFAKTNVEGQRVKK